MSDEHLTDLNRSNEPQSTVMPRAAGFPEQIYSLEELREILTSFHVCTGLNIQLSDAEGTMLLTIGEPVGFCSAVGSRPDGDSHCRRERYRAGRQTGLLGAAYFYTCHAGLCNIAFPIINRAQQFGTVIAGPFLLEDADDALTLPLREKYTLSDQEYANLSEQASALPVLTAVQAAQTSSLLGYLVGGYLTGTKEMMRQGKDRLLQQSRINESIQTYKNLTPDQREEYPIALENALISRTKHADTAGARHALNELLGYLLLYEAYDLEKLKIRVIELCSLLSRAAIDRDAAAAANTILDLNEKLIGAVISSDDFNEICFILSDNIEIFTKQFIESDLHHYAITKAIAYLSAHYSEPVTLPEIAEEIGVHPSYLSSLFRQVTGLTFREYLNSIRIEHAVALLTNTDYPIIEIAIACGFNDQSYFTKVFKKQTGMTPRQFR